MSKKSNINFLFGISLYKVWVWIKFQQVVIPLILQHSKFLTFSFYSVVLKIPGNLVDEINHVNPFALPESGIAQSKV